MKETTMTKTQKDYDALADWAENDMTLPERSTTATRGTAAAEMGRELLQRSAGRPSLSGDAQPGEHSPKRQVTLPKDISESVDALAARVGRKPAEVMREAITEYVQARAV
jgi:hypothetical protein